MPDTVSSTTDDSSASSCWSASTDGWMRVENRLATRLTNGSAPSASTARPALLTSRITATASTVAALAMNSGMKTRKKWICWMSLLARAISWPVCAWSWNAKWSRCRWANSRWRRSVSTRAATPMARYRRRPVDAPCTAPTTTISSVNRSRAPCSLAMMPRSMATLRQRTGR